MSDQQGNGSGSGRSLSRRAALQAGLIAAAGVGAGVSGLSPASASARPAWHHRPLRQPGSLPYPKLAEGTDTVPQIEHIVVLMMENHSYDNRLGMLRRPGADGFRLGRHRLPMATNPYSNGDIQHAFHMPTTCQLPGFPSQDWRNSHIQLDGGRNDGFVESGSGPVAMGYWDESDQPFYYSLARRFPIADRYFASPSTSWTPPGSAGRTTSPRCRQSSSTPNCSSRTRAPRSSRSLTSSPTPQPGRCRATR